MAVVKWTFYDPTTASTYVFAVNPSEGGSPSYSKNVNYQNTAAADGKTLVFEGRDEAQRLEWSGTILEQNQLDTFTTWFNKRHQILLTDDLSRQLWIYITKFTPKRERAIHSPYKHSYSMEATILNWA